MKREKSWIHTHKAACHKTCSFWREDVKDLNGNQPTSPLWTMTKWRICRHRCSWNSGHQIGHCKWHVLPYGPQTHLSGQRHTQSTQPHAISLPGMPEDWDPLLQQKFLIARGSELCFIFYTGVCLCDVMWFNYHCFHNFPSLVLFVTTYWILRWVVCNLLVWTGIITYLLS